MTQSTNPTRSLSRAALNIDCEAECDRIARAVRKALQMFKRKGLVVAMSGGIDSSTVAALCVHAVGPERVFGLFLPERDSEDESRRLAQQLADQLGIETICEVITPILEGAGCYRRRDEAIRGVVPEYGPGWKSKIVLPTVGEGQRYRIFSVVVQSPDGQQSKHRLTPEAYLGIVAATNFKQRVRKMMEYYHADRLNFIVAGTPNLLEYDQGFFVKNGDGSADLKPIAHLYKSQVYQLARHLAVPAGIINRPPTTDTYSLPQSQEEFYFSLPYDQMDLCLYAKNHGYAASEVAAALGLTEAQAEFVYQDIESKRKVTHYLGSPPLRIDEVLRDE